MNTLKLLNVLGQGSFGTAHLASWRSSLVAAKAIPLIYSLLKSGVKLAFWSKFEPNNLVCVAIIICSYRKMNHPNLSRCLGVLEGPCNITPLVLMAVLCMRGPQLRNFLYEILKS